MTWLTAYFTVYSIVGWIIRAGMLPTVLRRQFTPGAALAWLGIVSLHPYIGLSLYLLVGENRLGRGREARHRELVARYRHPDATPTPPSPIGAERDEAWKPVATQAMKVGQLPVLGANAVDFLIDSTAMTDRLVADINGARSTVHLLYYIFSPDATGQRVVAALIAAAGRGVACRVLADAYASGGIFRRNGLAAHLRQHNIQVAQALPRALNRRRDLRNHRKLAVIDGVIAFAGSQNLIDADYGGRCGGPWHDLTGRMTGPIVSELSALFAEDWAFETEELLEVVAFSDRPADARGIEMQAVPTGPVKASESYRRVLLAAIQCATRRLILTTPYFVPDDPTLVALMMAADRGVDVTLIVPRTPDQFFTAWAARSHFAKLMDSGVSIFLYRPGLIHSKTATVDDTVALFGSANLDVRSFNLNFELSILAYGPEVTDRLRDIQMAYVQDSTRLDLKRWSSRSVLRRYGEAAVSLVSPLL
ncbi:MAG TPA: cardiolipin synthase [Tepidisphaeraceae bacterium]|jgi:cardiolipin synthase|nr:cardiolipin synthase [Tepidisphaeraceae bacterium]